MRIQSKEHRKLPVRQRYSTTSSLRESKDWRRETECARDVSPLLGGAFKSLSPTPEHRYANCAERLAVPARYARKCRVHLPDQRR